MQTEIIEILESKDFNLFENFIKILMKTDINKNIYENQTNSLNALHFCIAFDKDIDFGLRCLQYLVSFCDIDINKLAKIDGILVTGAHIAVQWHHYNALQTLIDCGIDLFKCDSYGRTAYDYAIESKDEEISQLLITHMRSQTNNNSLIINYQNNCFSVNSNDNKKKKSLKSVINLSTIDENYENSEQTATNCEEKDVICEDLQNLSFDDNSKNSSENTLISNISYEKTDSIKSCDSDKTEIYIYKDRDHNITLIEERYESCVANGVSDANVDKLHSDIILKGCVTDDNSDQKLDQMIKQMSETQIFDELKAMGDSPGPITKTTKTLYAKRLINIRKGNHMTSPQKILLLPDFPEELNSLIENRFPFDESVELEQQLINCFESDKSNKNYFVYILLDPNISQNIVFDANKGKSIVNCWPQKDVNLLIRFVKSIFYVGKGQGNRVYQHFYEAINLNDRKNYSKKIERILKIWSTDKGVISLHCFHGISSDEALTREAVVIEALGLTNLTNQISGQNKCSLKWSERKRRIIGTYLVYKAFLILLLNGERQIKRPNH